MSRVSAAGGVPNKVVESGMSPTFLPDGRRFLYQVVSGKEPGVYLGALDASPSSQGRRITADVSNPKYVPPSAASPRGYILFVRQGTLMAQPVDPDSFQPAGDLFPVVERVANVALGSGYLYSISRNGILLHATGSGDLRQHAMFDRSGRQLATIGGPVGTLGRVALSPDEKRMASERGSFPGRQFDLWITELDGGRESRFTFDASANMDPVWSTDGNYVAFASKVVGPITCIENPPIRPERMSCFFDPTPPSFRRIGRMTAGSSSSGTGVSEDA